MSDTDRHRPYRLRDADPTASYGERMACNCRTCSRNTQQYRKQRNRKVRYAKIDPEA